MSPMTPPAYRWGSILTPHSRVLPEVPEVAAPVADSAPALWVLSAPTSFTSGSGALPFLPGQAPEHTLLGRAASAALSLPRHSFRQAWGWLGEFQLTVALGRGLAERLLLELRPKRWTRDASLVTLGGGNGDCGVLRWEQLGCLEPGGESDRRPREEGHRGLPGGVFSRLPQGQLYCTPPGHHPGGQGRAGASEGTELGGG